MMTEEKKRIKQYPYIYHFYAFMNCSYISIYRAVLCDSLRDIHGSIWIHRNSLSSAIVNIIAQSLNREGIGTVQSRSNFDRN